MSPFLYADHLNGALLMYHSMEDQNVGTAPINSIRMYQALQSLGSYYVKHSLTHATQTYGLFGVVLGLVAFLHLAALLTLLCAEVNVVRARRLWPRSLMTPFTDNVQLTDADERSYEALATTQQTKGFEDIDVSFDNPTQSR